MTDKEPPEPGYDDLFELTENIPKPDASPQKNPGDVMLSQEQLDEALTRLDAERHAQESIVKHPAPVSYGMMKPDAGETAHYKFTEDEVRGLMSTADEKIIRDVLHKIGAQQASDDIPAALVDRIRKGQRGLYLDDSYVWIVEIRDGTDDLKPPAEKRAEAEKLAHAFDKLQALDDLASRCEIPSYGSLETEENRAALLDCIYRDDASTLTPELQKFYKRWKDYEKKVEREKNPTVLDKICNALGKWYGQKRAGYRQWKEERRKQREERVREKEELNAWSNAGALDEVVEPSPASEHTSHEYDEYMRHATHGLYPTKDDAVRSADEKAITLRRRVLKYGLLPAAALAFAAACYLGYTRASRASPSSTAAATESAAVDTLMLLRYNDKEWLVPQHARASIAQYIKQGLNDGKTPASMEYVLQKASAADGVADHIIRSQGLQYFK